LERGVEHHGSVAAGVEMRIGEVDVDSAVANETGKSGQQAGIGYRANPAFLEWAQARPASTHA
jgi:hypothetical protein